GKGGIDVRQFGHWHSLKMIREAIGLSVGCALTATCLRLFVKDRLDRLRTIGKSFNYFISDLWLATITFVPTVGIGVEIQRHHWMPPLWLAIPIAGVLALFQLAGAANGRIELELPPFNGSRSSMQRVFGIMIGAGLGFVTGIVSLMIAA